MNPVYKWALIGIAAIIILGTAGWIFYAGLIRPTTKPNPSTIMAGQEDNYNYTVAPRQTFGCMNIRIPKKDQ